MVTESHVNVTTCSGNLLSAAGFDDGAITAIANMCNSWMEALSPNASLQVACIHAGRTILSIWGGRDGFSGDPIARDSLFPLLSATKGVAAIVLLYLHDQGYFDWDDPVVKYWPSFGKRGKKSCTVAHVLSHRAGLPHVTAHWSKWTDRRHMTVLVENATPLWPPGHRYGYHGGSWGVMVDELVRIWTGCTTGEILRSAILPRLREAGDCYVGLPRAEYGRVVRLMYIERDQLDAAFPLAPFDQNGGYNSQRVLASCQSSGGGVASAEALAQLYSLIARRGRSERHIWWSGAGQAYATTAQNDPDAEAPAARPDVRLAWGMGFTVSPSADMFGSSPLSKHIAGHAGASGCIGYGDPASGLSAALTVNGIGAPATNRARFRQLGDMLAAAAARSSNTPDILRKRHDVD